MNMRLAKNFPFTRLVGCLIAVVVSISEAAETPTAEQLKFFETNIRPVLADSCYSCHSEKAEKVKGDLLLDTRDGIRKGGENGPAVVPGDLAKSLLIEAIRYTDPDKAMPPERKGKSGKLPDAVIANFEQWVKMGAPDPREGTAKVVKKYNLDTAKSWWAYQPVKKPAVPQPSDAAWAKTDIDRFILTGLEEKKLKPMGDADKATLLRRLAFDLTGLPPAPETIEAFLNKPHTTYEQIVDDYLKSPRYGERWGRHWMDVARYAETSGRDVNLVQPEAWRYRDYVVESFDQDKPFDQFIREQLAGDLLPDKSDEERAKNLIATGFLAMGPKSMNEVIARQFAVDLADEQIDATSQAFLGVTIACARCHDHKFDPISQRDYTALAGIFLSTETRFGTPGGNQNRNASTLIEMPATLKMPLPNRRMDPAMWRRKTNAVADYLAQRDEELRLRNLMGDNLNVTKDGRVTNEGQAPTKGRMTDFDLVRISTIAAQLGSEVSAYNPDGSPKAMLMGVLDRPTAAEGPRRGMRTGPKKRTGFEVIGDSPLFVRGSILKETDRVPRALPSFLARESPATISDKTSGRLELANWIASPQNTLTSRVIVNRVWHWLFGRGLVASVDNFGTTGALPSNAALLDHLAARFVEQGWSVKKLIREIVLSRAYQLASDNDEARLAADPDNNLVWRANQRRLDAECIRDGMLAASGALDVTRQVGSLLANVGDGPVGGPRNKVIVEEPIIKANGNFRSLYLPIARSVTAETLAVFDFSDPAMVLGARQNTTVPPQALYLMNSEFVGQQSAALAARVLKSLPATKAGADDSFDQRFRLACLLVWSRPPFPDETKAAREYAAAQSADDASALWTHLCRALFGSAEYRYLN